MSERTQLPTLEAFDDSFQELDTLAAALRDDALTDEQCRRLESLVAAREDLAERLVAHLHLTARLHWQHGAIANAFPVSVPGANEAATANGDTFEAQRGGKHAAAVARASSQRAGSLFSRWRVSSFVAAVAVVCMLAVLAAFNIPNWRRDTALSDPPKPTPPATVARFVRGYDAKWADGCEPPRARQALHAGERLALEAGLAEIRFHSGVKIVLEGPAHIKLAKNKAYLSDGRVAAIVPEAARGFAIGTPEVNVVDLGTEFAVAVRERKTLVRVYEGEVELIAVENDAATPSQPANPPQPPVRLGRDRAMRIEGGKFTPDDEAPDDFVRAVPSRPSELAFADAYSQQIERSRPVAYWKFNGASQDRIPNAAREANEKYVLERRGEVAFAGDAGDAEQVMERFAAAFPGSDAGETAQRLNCLVLEEPLEELKQSNYTVELWMRADRRPATDQTLIAFSDKASVGDRAPGTMFLLELAAHGPRGEPYPEGALRVLHRHAPSERGGVDVAVADAYKPGVWYHVVVAKDRREIALYVNGVEKFKQPAELAFDRAPPRLILGGLTPDERWLARPFGGRLAHVAIYNRTLANGEIRAHYRAAHAAPSEE